MINENLDALYLDVKIKGEKETLSSFIDKNLSYWEKTEIKLWETYKLKTNDIEKSATSLLAMEAHGYFSAYKTIKEVFLV